MPRQVHHVGNIGLDTSEEVFASVGRLLGPYLRRVPDGEPAGRLDVGSMAGTGATCELVLSPGQSGVRTTWSRLTLADDIAEEEINFGELGYSREARAPYQDVLAVLRKTGLHKTVRVRRRA